MSCDIYIYIYRKGVSKEEAIKTCGTCKGKGRVARTIQMGPMISQTITECHACGGKGKSIDDKFKCKKCRGKCVTEDIKVIEVLSDKGVPEGEKYIFHGEGDEKVYIYIYIYIYHIPGWYCCGSCILC